jgi:hypothetical protein
MKKLLIVMVLLLVPCTFWMVGESAEDDRNAVSGRALRASLRMRNVVAGYEWLGSNTIFFCQRRTHGFQAVLANPMKGQQTNLSFLSPYLTNAEAFEWTASTRSALILSVFSRERVSYIVDLNSQAVKRLPKLEGTYYCGPSGIVAAIERKAETLWVRTLSEDIYELSDVSGTPLGFDSKDNLILALASEKKGGIGRVVLTFCDLANNTRRNTIFELISGWSVDEIDLSSDGKKVLIKSVVRGSPYPKRTDLWCIDLLDGSKTLVYETDRKTRIYWPRVYEGRVSFLEGDYFYEIRLK